MAGISRSVTLVIAYMIKHMDKSYSEAYSHFKIRRHIVNHTIKLDSSK